jgi:hypothetical protein
MNDNVETMADLIDRLFPAAESEPDGDRDVPPDRDDLPELASALKQTGRILHRGRDGEPVVYEAIVDTEGAHLLVRRVAFLSRMIRPDEGGRIPADDASEARDRGARLASEVRVPKP